MLLADTHCHLADPIFDPDRSAVVERARQAGVTHILAVGTDLASSRASVALAQEFAEVYAAIGLHPHEAAQFGPETLAGLRRLAAEPKVVALGEIGLDYYRGSASPAAQQAAFRAQLVLAAELELPVVVHDRDAHDDVLRLIAEPQRSAALAGRSGVLHCFSGSTQMASRAHDLGFAVSFTGSLTFARADETRATAEAIPLQWALVETDGPFLAPVPYRGQRNEPAFVRLVAERLAGLHHRSLADVADETTANAARLFSWKEDR